MRITSERFGGNEGESLGRRVRLRSRSPIRSISHAERWSRSNRTFRKMCNKKDTPTIENLVFPSVT